MSSKTRSHLPDIEAASRDLLAPVRATLAALAVDPARHALFLNTLSLMEHIGSRKIMASQAKGPLHHDTLKHLAEEARHAFFFKRAAEKCARAPLDYGKAVTLAGAQARAYMGRLDAAIAADTGARGAMPYLYMSLVVELRAIWLYRLYEKVLTETKAGIALKSVVAEEELHLEAMVAELRALDPDFDARLPRLVTLEDRRFRILWAAIEAEAGLKQAAE